MKHAIVLLPVSLIAIVVVCLCTFRPADADPAPTRSDPVAVVAAPAAPLPSLSPPVRAADEKSAALQAYALSVMQGWTPANPRMPTADYGSVARDIGLVSASPRDAALLAGLAYFEGARFAAYVDEQLCNDPDWRKSPEGIHQMRVGGDCDHGHAYSLWQIHPIQDPTSSLYVSCNADAVQFDRLSAARCALEMARDSLASYGDLHGYTGEPSFEHPKADLRLDFVNAALTKHAFKP